MTNFITGEKFQELAEGSIALNVESNFASNLVKEQLNNTNTKCYIFNPGSAVDNLPEEIKKAKSIFVYTHILPFFFESIFPKIDTSFTLITHNSDAGVGPEYLSFLEDDKIKKWFCQNKYITHPKLHSLPIAIANSQWSHGNLSALEKVIQEHLPKNKLVFKSFDMSTNPGHRHQANHDTNQNGFEMVHNMPFTEYIKQLKQSYFSFAPLGNGADCHRIWECLYLNCVPVVPKSPPCFNDFQDLPILFVDDYKNITKEFLESQIETFHPFSKYKLDVLDLNYWRQNICTD